MTRPWIIWVTALVCGFIVIASLGMVTIITIDQEREIYIEREKRDRISKAAWVMESHARTLIAREDGRAASDFTPLQTVFSRDEKDQNVKVENKLSPLFAEKPVDVKHYWFGPAEGEVNIDLVSPQVPSWGVIEHLAPDKEAKQTLADNIQQHNQIQQTLQCQAVWNADYKGSSEAQRYSTTNLGKARFVANSVSVRGQKVKKWTPTQQKELTEALNNRTVSWANTNEKAFHYQSNAVKEKQLRAAINSKLYSKAGKFKVANKEKPKSAEGYDLNYAAKVQKVAGNDTYNGSNSDIENPFLGSFSFSEVSPFVASKIGEELMLLRNVATPNGGYVQGVVLDKEKVIEDMLVLAKAYLPNANLSVVQRTFDNYVDEFTSNDPLVLSALPFKIEPGVIPNNLEAVTPMRLILIVAWACVLCAIFAVAIMFRGIMGLSERRASFVSSVSHELRTPLTTFKLYTEMLSSGMVKDEEKKQGYLEKLTTESDRLSHMVENVLSFSQIERGKCKRECQGVYLGGMIERAELNIIPRLEEASVKWHNTIPSALLKVKLNMDMTSVDQILMNLVDNAVKYGQPEHGQAVVMVSATKSAKFLKIRISDNGRGVKKSESKKLFKAFHKSDIEAAHSKPGVGLGLALCRGLARSMGGNLTLINPSPSGSGACFELSLLISDEAK